MPARGFTLVEILAVVIILGIASAMILPQLGSRDDLKAAAAARAIMADLIFAQNRAIAMQRTHYIRFDIGTQRYTVLSEISPSDVVVTHPVSKNSFITEFGTNVSGMRDVTLVSASFNGQLMLAFDDLGTPLFYNGTALSPMTSGEIVIRSGEQQLTIGIEPFTGEIAVK
jgi:prepilin-type N-terminal cleavage/methylation domain-containing protein